MSRVSSGAMPVARATRSGVNPRDRGPELLGTRAMLADRALIGQILLEHHVQEREQEGGVGVGHDRHVLAHATQGLGPPRVDHDHAPAPPLDGRQPFDHARSVDEGTLADGGIGPDQQHELRALEIGHRMRHRRSEHPLRDDELVVAVQRLAVKKLRVPRAWTSALVKSGGA